MLFYSTFYKEKNLNQNINSGIFIQNFYSENHNFIKKHYKILFNKTIYVKIMMWKKKLKFYVWRNQQMNK